MKISDLAGTPDKLELRADYVKAEGYEVTLRVTYERTRRVRALSEEQAKTFAAAREATYAPRYFVSQNHAAHTIVDIEVVSADKVRYDMVDD